MGVSPTPRTARALLALLVALALPLVGLGAGAHASSTPQTWTVQVGSQTPNMAIQGARFLPGQITIDAGDTVTWVARSAEIHTVTFFDNGAPQTSIPPFNPTDPLQLLPQGGATFAPDTYFNSGILTNVPPGGDIGPFPPGVPHFQTYSLTFPDPGTYTYYCLVHGVMMVGVIDVQNAGAPYPLTQQQYDQQARLERVGLNREGMHLWAQLRQRATNHQVFAGDDNGAVMVMRFVRATVVVHRGESVEFKNIGMGAPHTVTFGQEPANPFAPVGDPTHYSGGDLSSGIIPGGGTFTVTFDKKGTFHYICALHDAMGMKGKVIVRP